MTRTAHIVAMLSAGAQLVAGTTLVLALACIAKPKAAAPPPVPVRAARVERATVPIPSPRSLK